MLFCGMSVGYEYPTVKYISPILGSVGPVAISPISISLDGNR